MPLPILLRVEQHVIRLHARVAYDAVGMHGAEHGQAVFGLVVVDGMAAHDKGAGLAHLVGAAAHDLADDVGAQRDGKRQYVERDQRLCAHGEHVGKRVCRGDAAKLVGVVAHRREKVERQHRGRVVIDAVDGSIVARVEPQQQLGIGGRRDLLHDFLEVTRTPLGGSTALLGHARKVHAAVLVDGLARRHRAGICHMSRPPFVVRRAMALADAACTPIIPIVSRPSVCARGDACKALHAAAQSDDAPFAGPLPSRRDTRRSKVK